MIAAKANHSPLAPPSVETLNRYNEWQASLRESDFPGLCKYRTHNAALPAASKHHVFLFGDSITELWRLNAPEFFTDNVIDRGISGQTTEQMLAASAPM